MLVFLRWLKIDFSSKNRSRVKILRWLTFKVQNKFRIIFASNWISLRILNHLRIFELKKVSHLRIMTRNRFFEQKLKRTWMVRILSNLKITCIFNNWTNILRKLFELSQRISRTDILDMKGLDYKLTEKIRLQKRKSYQKTPLNRSTLSLRFFEIDGGSPRFLRVHYII